MAYYEHPSYVMLLRRAYELWREIELRSGEQLLHITGSIDAGAADSWRRVLMRPEPDAYLEVAVRGQRRSEHLENGAEGGHTGSLPEPCSLSHRRGAPRNRRRRPRAWARAS